METDSISDVAINNLTVGTTKTTLTMPGKLFRLRRGIQLKAGDGNSGLIYIKDSPDISSTNSFILDKGQGIFIPVDNPAKIYLLGSASGQSVQYVMG